MSTKKKFNFAADQSKKQKDVMVDNIRSTKDILTDYERLSAEWGNLCIQHKLQEYAVMNRHKQLDDELRLAKKLEDMVAEGQGTKLEDPVQETPAEEVAQ